MDDRSWNVKRDNWSAPSSSGISLNDFVSQVYHFRRLELRVYIILLSYSGDRRSGDIHEVLESLCVEVGLQSFIVSVDLGFNNQWDLGSFDVHRQLMEQAGEGLIDGVFGGPRVLLLLYYASALAGRALCDYGDSTSGGYLTSILLRLRGWLRQTNSG